MAHNDYIYQVARIRSRELTLLNDSIINQLINAKSYNDALVLLKEHGYGSERENISNIDELLSVERHKTWEFMRELLGEDLSPLEILLLANDFHNLKAAAKQRLVEHEIKDIYTDDGLVSKDIIIKAVTENDFSILPEHLKQAKEAYEVLLHTGDGQLFDVVVDRLNLEAVNKAGQASKCSFIKTYAELFVASSLIKIALRCQATGKDIDFLKKAFTECKSLNIDRLQQATLEGKDAIAEYLSHTDYSAVAELIPQGSTAIELWFDNYLVGEMKSQLIVSEGEGPIIAFLLARENELKTVRIILSGLLNALDTRQVRERIRSMYV